jgi:DDE superfamily endonuclease
MPLYVPSSLDELLFLFRPCFTAPTHETFRALVTGFLAQVGTHTVTGCLLASQMSFRWHHSRAHRFFSRARWSRDELGLKLLEVVLERLLSTDATIELAIDDTLIKRWGRKVFGRHLHYDASAGGPGKQLAHGNCWVVVGIVVRLPFLDRPLCLPALFRLWRPRRARYVQAKRPDPERPGKVELARELCELVAERFAWRRVALVGDSAYAAKGMRGMSGTITLTTRPRANAALHAPKPERTGKAGRPAEKGERLPSLGQIANDPARADEWASHEVLRYGKRERVEALVVDCLWYSVFGGRPQHLVLVRDPGTATGYDLALITDDLVSSAAAIVERYAARWSIEVAFEEAKGIFGVGEARNRVPVAVERAAPFGFICMSLAIVWYALAGHSPEVVAEHRARARWYRTKRTPSVADMLVKLRRTIIAARYLPTRLQGPSSEEIQAVAQAWAAAGV